MKRVKTKTLVTLPSDRFVVRWHERLTRSGTGPKQLLVGSEAFPGSELERLMAQTRQLVQAGYLVTITPPLALAVEAAEAA